MIIREINVDVVEDYTVRLNDEVLGETEIIRRSFPVMTDSGVSGITSLINNCFRRRVNII